MVTLFKPLLDRQAFIWANRIGKTINLGCNDGSLTEHGHRIIGLPFTRDAEWLINFDCDKWLIPNLVRGDAHRLPFKDNSLDTAVLGDIAEHLINPVIALKEVDRITRQKIIITIPNEAEWHESLKPFHDPVMTKQQVIDATIHHPSTYSKCSEYLDEEKFHHLPHIRHFSFYMISEWLNKSLSKRYKININNFYHSLAPQNPNEAEDMPYWGIIIDKTVIEDEKLKVGEI